MNAVNYDGVMQSMMVSAEGKRLLLHSCCAPCSSACLERLAPVFRITVLYYNPNLDSEAEYGKRKAEQIRFLQETGYADILDCEYSPEDFSAVAEGYEEEKEGGARCMRCFRLRLERTAREAALGGYDFFATTLTLSPLKNAAAINAIGMETGEKYGVTYLPSDFKKRGGYQRSLELSREYGLYRQNYCGCRFSRR